MRTFMLILSMLTIVGTAFCQVDTPEEAEIKDVIQRLFEGMRTGDSAMIHATFSRKVTLATVSVDKEGVTVLGQDEALQGFLNAAGTPHKEVWNEETWNYKVQIDGRFAQVWCDYAFFFGLKFSHCGVDAFQLAKINGTWKIFHLADTRQKDNCIVPDNIFPKTR